MDFEETEAWNDCAGEGQRCGRRRSLIWDRIWKQAVRDSPSLRIEANGRSLSNKSKSPFYNFRWNDIFPLSDDGYGWKLAPNQGLYIPIA
jgi:hypothetical protein